ncbi:DUF3054 family protein [Mycobacterium uberis]|uniref:DUF3054 family protein n=1 Tax=Mycobacterium uberis TaxID=2162698 RepID=UPI001FB263C6|nr:DUF3054 family protein [Mycobacterium uberis]
MIVVWAGVASIDIVAVLVFALLGAAVLSKDLPLLVLRVHRGRFLSEWLSDGWWRFVFVVPTGVVFWLCTVVVGMVLREVGFTGAVVSFVMVAALVTVVLLFWLWG